MQVCRMMRMVSNRVPSPKIGPGRRMMLLRCTAKKPQKITSSYIGYTIAPRINAAGRIRSASLAVELLLSEDPERIRLLAEELCDANAERQEEENRIMRQAFDLIESEHDFARDPVIVLDSDEWHHGVIGIVSSRITEHYGLPSILVSFEGAEGPAGPSPDDVGKGSGRSVPGLNLVDALTAYQDLLVKYGGHELAAGLSIRRGDLPTFREKINEYARNKLSEETLTRTFDADCILCCSDLSLELAESIARMEPFGTGNPTPCFVSRDLVVSEITKISGGKHTRLLVGDGSVAYQAMCFGMTESDLDLYVGEKADLLYSLDINEYAGRRSLQLIVRDLHKAGASDDTRQKERKALELILDGQKPDEIAVPELTRRDFAAVYQLIRETIALGSHLFSLRGMISRLSCGQPGSFDYLKLQLILQIFLETHLITLSEEGEDLLSIRLCPTEGKIDLEKSKILSRVRMLASR